jgi:hypothetical protein
MTGYWTRKTEQWIGQGSTRHSGAELTAQGWSIVD